MIVKLICYDIEEDNIRTKIANKIASFGCIRIQKSVFCGELSELHWQKCQQKIETIFETNKKPNDSIYFINIGKRNFKQLKTLGQEPDFENIINEKTILWI